MYPLHRVDDILDAVGGTQYFSTLDLASGYWQVELDEAAREKSAFTTFKGLYEFTQAEHKRIIIVQKLTLVVEL